MNAERIVIPDVWGADVTTLRHSPGPPPVWDVHVEETAKWVAYWSEAARRTEDLVGKLLRNHQELLQ